MTDEPIDRLLHFFDWFLVFGPSTIAFGLVSGAFYLYFIGEPSSILQEIIAVLPGGLLAYWLANSIHPYLSKRRDR